MSIPRYLYEGRLVPLSKNKGKDQAELKDMVNRGDLLAFADDMLIQTNSKAEMT